MRKSFDQLKRISLLLTAIYVALVLFPVTAHAGSGFFGAEANRAAVLVYIDKTNQQMTVSLDGAETYTATSMNEIWYSKEFDNAPMPHSIFFMKDGHAIHGSFEVKNLGKPVSHGCVRISPQNAAILYELVRENGLENTKVVLTGSSPGAVARGQTSRRGDSSGPSSDAPSHNRSQGYDRSPWSW
jgi:lipoprotein-anchoring transpeptidase ErfK/SrfK